MKNIKTQNFIRLCSSGLLVIILIVSGLSKIIDAEPLLKTLEAVQFIPAEWQSVISSFIPIWELALAILLFFNKPKLLTITAAACTFAMFLAVSVYYSLISPLNSDCGCFGSFVQSRFDIWMVLRNSFFFLISCGLFIDAYKNRDRKSVI